MNAPVHPRHLGDGGRDRLLTNPAGADDLYRSLVDTPARQPRCFSSVRNLRLALPWKAFDPFDDDEPDDFARGPALSPRCATIASTAHEMTPTPGWGYPSCCRALARVAKKFHRSRRLLPPCGVRPDASVDEIKKALRTKYRRCHPDGWAPNADEFDYLREIATVLLNVARAHAMTIWRSARSGWTHGCAMRWRRPHRDGVHP